MYFLDTVQLLLRHAAYSEAVVLVVVELRVEKAGITEDQAVRFGVIDDGTRPVEAVRGSDVGTLYYTTPTKK